MKKISNSGCFGCRYRKMNECAAGRKEYPNGGKVVCVDTKKRPGFRKYEVNDQITRLNKTGLSERFPSRRNVSP